MREVFVTVDGVKLDAEEHQTMLFNPVAEITAQSQSSKALLEQGASEEVVRSLYPLGRFDR
jgi:hypothetical protein